MKTNRSIFKILAFSFIAVTFFSCAKDEVKIELPEVRAGFYILNEGGFNSNNSSLDYYNLENSSLVSNFFTQKNSRGLGDTGNDAQIYGSKIYIVVNGSNTLEIVNAQTVASIKQIRFLNNNVGRQPRSIVFDKNKAFISSYDGTVAVLDTASLTIEKYITVGRNPEEMAIANNKLYVVNSGAFDPTFDKTVSVIDLNTFTEVKKITIVENPTRITASSDGLLYITSPGNYGNIKSSLTIIDSKTDIVKSSKPFTGSRMQIDGDKAYFVSETGIIEYDRKNDVITRDNVITDGARFDNIYGFNYDKVNRLFYVTDAKNFVSNGEVSCFGLDGKLKYKIRVGINPSKVIFLNK